MATWIGLRRSSSRRPPTMAAFTSRHLDCDRAKGWLRKLFYQLCETPAPTSWSNSALVGTLKNQTAAILFLRLHEYAQTHAFGNEYTTIIVINAHNHISASQDASVVGHALSVCQCCLVSCLPKCPRFEDIEKPSYRDGLSKDYHRCVKDGRYRRWRLSPRSQGK